MIQPQRPIRSSSAGALYGWRALWRIVWTAQGAAQAGKAEEAAARARVPGCTRQSPRRASRCVLGTRSMILRDHALAGRASVEARVRGLLRERRQLGAHRRHPHKGLRGLARVVGGLRDAPQIRLHGVAERGERDERLAMEQRAAELAFQRSDGVGQRGLRHTAALGRAGEVAFLAERQEVTDLMHLHDDPDAFRLTSPSRTAQRQDGIAVGYRG